MGNDEYLVEVDMWAIGCIFAELYLKTALFQGCQKEEEILEKCFNLFGTPQENGCQDRYR